MSEKITQLLTKVLILSLGFGQLLRWELHGIPVYLHDALVVAILLLNWRQTSKALFQKVFIERRSTGILLIMAGCVGGGVYLLSHFPFGGAVRGLLYSARILAYLALFAGAVHRGTKIPDGYFLLSGAVTALIGLVQYIFMPDMRWAQFIGWDDHLNRVVLPHFDPTFTGVMLGLALFASFSQTQKFAIRYALYIIFPLMLTYARSVWISMVFAMMVTVRNKKIGLFAAVVMVMAFILLPKKFGEGTNLLRTYSISSRIYTDVEIVKGLKYDFLLGRGMNYYAVMKDSKNGYPVRSSGPNNSFVYILATTGVLGMLGWITFLVYLYKKSSHKSELAFFIIASIFNNVLFYPFALIWVLLRESVSD